MSHGEAKRRRVDDVLGNAANLEMVLARSDLDTRLHITNINSLRRHLKELERKTTLNSELRAKFPNDPTKFIQSECDLSEEIGMFKALAATPELLPTFQESALTFLSLLNHQNQDIAMLATSVLSEITEPDVLNALDKIGEEKHEGKSLGAEFVRYLMEEIDLFSSLSDNLNRLNEFSAQEPLESDDTDEEEDAPLDEFKGVTEILDCVSNLCEALPEVADAELLSSKKLIVWMLNRIRGDADETNMVDYNRQYSAEILSALCQRNEKARTVVAVELKGLDMLLETMASFRKKQSLNLHEEEFLHNVKNCLVCFLLDEKNKDHFHESEGVILMARLLLAKLKLFHSWALELLAVAVTNHRANCEQLFKQGLGGIFSYLETKAEKAQVHNEKRLRTLEQITAIIKSVAMLAQGVNQDRLIAKFFENDAAKLKILVGLFITCFETLQLIGAEENWNLNKYETAPSGEAFKGAAKDEKATLEYDDKCDAGLITLQNVALILLALCRYGNDVVTMQIHAYLAQQFGETKLLYIWANVIVEMSEFAPLSDEDKKDMADALQRHISDHESFCKRVEELKGQAAQRALERAAEAKNRQREEQSEVRRQRNRDRKQREKIKKYDRELERREQLEEYRYARKTGTLW